MTGTGLISEELQPTPTPSRPRPVAGVAVVGLLLALVGVALMVLAALRLRDYNDGAVAATIVGALLVLGSLYPLWPSIRSFAGARERAALLRDDQLVLARRAAAAGREEAQIAMGYAAAAIIVAAILLMAFANEGGIAETFFTSAAWRASFPEMFSSFWINIWVAVV